MSGYPDRAESAQGMVGSHYATVPRFYNLTGIRSIVTQNQRMISTIENVFNILLNGQSHIYTHIYYSI